MNIYTTIIIEIYFSGVLSANHTVTLSPVSITTFLRGDKVEESNREGSSKTFPKLPQCIEETCNLLMQYVNIK